MTDDLYGPAYRMGANRAIFYDNSSVTLMKLAIVVPY